MSDFEPGRLPWEAAFSTKISQARASAEMSQEELARRLREYGLPMYAHDVQDVESGVRPILLNEALVIAKVLRVELPEVTTTVRAEQITRGYSQSLAKVDKEWDGIVASLANCRRQVIQVLSDSMDVHSSYVAAVDLADGDPAPELIASMQTLTQRISTVLTGLAQIDEQVDGALSRSTAALVPGAQGQSGGRRAGV